MPATNVFKRLATPAIRTRLRVPLNLPGGASIEADIVSFTGLSDNREHLALGLGPYARVETPLVRPHSECLTGDVLGSARCDCGSQLREAIERLHAVGGYLLYLRQEGRGIGLYNKLDAYALQDQGLDTYQANRSVGFADDTRDYRAAAEMLRALGVGVIDLLTNNPDKAAQLRRLGLAIRAIHPTSTFVTDENLRYLQAKADRMGHTLQTTNPRAT